MTNQLIGVGNPVNPLPVPTTQRIAAMLPEGPFGLRV